MQRAAHMDHHLVEHVVLLPREEMRLLYVDKDFGVAALHNSENFALRRQFLIGIRKELSYGGSGLMYACVELTFSKVSTL